jgi:ABC-2 type transport system permease protein
MADVVAQSSQATQAGEVGLTEQIRLIAALRWRILRNHLRRKNNWLDLIGIIAAAFWSGVVILGLAIAFGFGAYTSLSTGHMVWITLLFFAIFVFWQLFPLFVAGFGVTFQFRALLRFPLSLTAFYLIALAYGLVDFAAIASMCWLLAMVIGAGLARPEILPAIILIAALSIVMSVTLERLIGSWFERLLARRLTRELTFGLVILISVSAQFIKPLMDHYQHGAPQTLWHVLPYLSAFPPGLAARAIIAAMNHQTGSILMSAAGLCLYIVLFSVLLWQRFRAQYRGEELSESAAPAIAVRAVSRTDAGADIRFISPPVVAVLQKEFRYLVRNSFILISLLMPPFLVLLFSSRFSGISPVLRQHNVSSDLFFPGMMGYLLLMLMMPVYNCFAYEGPGIQTYFTAPVRFRDVFVAKNLMHVGILTFETSIAVALLAWRIGLPSLPVLIATLIAVVFAAAGQFSLANWASLSFPRKLEFGSMRGQRGSGVAIWIGFASQLVLGAVCSVVLWMGRWTGNPWLPAEAFALLAVAALGGYFASLDALTVLADKKRENLIEVLCR